jgi:hypothetical protein
MKNKPVQNRDLILKYYMVYNFRLLREFVQKRTCENKQQIKAIERKKFI